MRKIILFSIILSSGLLSSCKRHVAPQLPSNKGIEVDSVEINLIKINENLAQREDSVLQVFLHETDTSFVKHKLGFWYKIEKRTKNSQLSNNDFADFYCQLFLLDGKQVKEERINVQLGKKMLTKGLESGLLLLRKGETATFVVPWYLAFGMKGNGAEVPPYTSVIYRVKIN
jgi:FKBP-type peptidyl-prolyl cis-trans isomerase